jgi:hypothetical protein
LRNVAEDKFHQDREWVLAKQAGAADSAVAARGQLEYWRSAQALFQLGAQTEYQAGVDAGALYANFSAAAKGECVMLHQNAFVDPDVSSSMLIRAAMDDSPFKEGDQVTGARLAGSPGWRQIDSWDALWEFTSKHGEMLEEKGWQVRVVRGGQEVAILMNPACASKAGR